MMSHSSASPGGNAAQGGGETADATDTRSIGDSDGGRETADATDTRSIGDGDGGGETVDATDTRSIGSIDDRGGGRGGDEAVGATDIGNDGGNALSERHSQRGSSAVGEERASRDWLAQIVVFVTLFAGLASYAEIHADLGTRWAIIGIACTILIVIAAALRRRDSRGKRRRVYLVVAAATTVISAAILVVLAETNKQSSKPATTPTPARDLTPTGKRYALETEPLRDPGVRLVAETPSDTVVHYSWKVVKPLPKGMTARFPVAMDPIVDPDNPHAEFYPWPEIVDDQGDRETTKAPDIGGVRIVRIYAVDATCANRLRAGGKIVKKLCQTGEAREDSDAIKATMTQQ